MEAPVKYCNNARVALALAYAVWSVAGSLPAAAEVVLDGTTGPAGALPGPDFAIPAEVGRRAGGNLFHSFRSFNLAQPESATFTGPAGIANVISRVTGDERSSIDGTLRSTVPGADLWFLNPAGVVFGPNARLDVQGSFHVSTADELRFTDGAVFSARDPSASSLTVAPPDAFGFLGATPTDIAVDRGRLSVPVGEALSLVGGDITVSGGNNGAASGGEAGTVRAEAGRITLAALGGPGAVDATGDENTAETGAAIRLVDQALVDVSGDGGGMVRVRGGRFVVANQASIFANNTGSMDSTGGIDVRAQAVSISGDSALTVDVNGSGSGGTLSIRSEGLILSGGGAFQAATFDTGAGGSIRIHASHALINNGFIGADSREGATETADAGSIIINAGHLVFLNEGRIFNGTNSAGDGGDITVIADTFFADATPLDHEPRFHTGASASANPGSSGRGGDVTVAAREIRLLNGGQISSGTGGTGAGGDVGIHTPRLYVNNGFIGSSTSGPAETADAGSVLIDAGRVEFVNEGRIFNGTNGAGAGGDVAVTVDVLSADATVDHDARFHTGIASTAEAGSTGAGGDITISARRIDLSNGGLISTATFGAGAGGDVTIRAPSRLSVNNGFIGASTSGPAETADAGSVLIDAGRVEFVNEGRIFNGTDGPGAGGNIVVVADMVSADARPLDHEPRFHTGISASANPGSSGRGGRVVVSADSILLKNGGQISSDSDGGGDAGPIEVTAPVIKLLDDGNIASFSTGDGAAGNISIVAAQRLFLDEGFITTVSDNTGGGRITFKVGELLELRDGSEISSSVFGGADTTAGNITIDPRFLVLHDSSILAQANEGTGGSIDIVADNILRSPGSRIDASSRLGIDGTVSTSAPEVDLTGRLAVLESAFLDAASQLRERCGERRGGGTGSFTGMGRGGLGVGPDAPLPGFYADLIGAEPDAAAGSPAPEARLTATEMAWSFAPVGLAISCGG
jgi:filamentous hemagglutinin family protein